MRATAVWRPSKPDPGGKGRADGGRPPLPLPPFDSAAVRSGLQFLSRESSCAALDADSHDLEVSESAIRCPLRVLGLALSRAPIMRPHHRDRATTRPQPGAAWPEEASGMDRPPFPVPGSAEWLETVDLTELTDEAFFLQMRACGKRVRDWDDRYIGLLVGANDRDLPRKFGFRDVFHMAAVQARMTRQRVQEVLGVAEKVRCCPGLYRMFVRAQVAWTKVRTVARLARPELDEELSLLVQSKTRRQIEEWVRQVGAAAHGRHPFVSRSRTMRCESPATDNPNSSLSGGEAAGTTGGCGAANGADVIEGTTRRGDTGTREGAHREVGPVASPHSTRDSGATASQPIGSTVGVEAGTVAGGTANTFAPTPWFTDGATPMSGVASVLDAPSASGYAATPGVPVEPEATGGPGTAVTPEVGGRSVPSPSPGVGLARPASPPLEPVALGQPHPDAQSQPQQEAQPELDPRASESACATESQHSGRRAAPPDRAVEALLSVGLDPLDVQQVLLHREVLTGIRGRAPTITEVLSQAIRSYRPSGQPVKLPYLLVLTRCRECTASSVDTVFGSAPVDEADEMHLAQSGRAVDLDHELANVPEPASASGSSRLERMVEEAIESCGVTAGGSDGQTDSNTGTTGGATGGTTGGEAGRVAGEPERGAVAGALAPRAAQVDSAERRGAQAGEAAVMGGQVSADSRELSARERRFLLARQGGRCAARGCPRPPSQVHHLDHFAHTRRHDLDRVWLVCRLHHGLVHGGFIENPADPPDRWRLRLTLGRSEPVDSVREELDKRYDEHVQSPARRDEELARNLAAES